MSEPERVGLTEKGIRLYLAIKAVFQEHAVWTERTTPEGEPLLRSSEDALRAMTRAWERLWRKVGFARDPAREDVLMELAIRPRPTRELERRIWRKDGLPPSDTRRAVRELLEAGLATEDLDEAYVE